MQMEDTAMDYQADEELRKLEERMGLSGPTTTGTELKQDAVSDVDAQLAELEKRIQGGQA